MLAQIVPARCADRLLSGLDVVRGCDGPPETVSTLSRCYLSAVLFPWHRAALLGVRRYLSSPVVPGRGGRLTKWLNVARYSQEMCAPPRLYVFIFPSHG